MKHLFLTGESHAGKSTLIRRALAARPLLRVGGFCTVVREGDIAGAVGGVYLLPGDAPDAPTDERNRVGIRWRDRSPQGFADAFDHLGVACLAPQGRDILLMDELGRMERDAMLFQRAVMRALDGDVPVLGVVKMRQAPFLDAVRAHPRVEVLSVTPQSRDALLAVVADWLEAVAPRDPRGVFKA